MFKANPITGVGLGGYWAGITEYHDASGSLTPQEAHNDYLELLASGGLVGAFFGGWFLLVLAKRIKSHVRSANSFRRGARYGALLGIIGVLTHSLLNWPAPGQRFSIRCDESNATSDITLTETRRSNPENGRFDYS